MNLKACLHLHIDQDTIDDISYSATKAIDHAVKHGFQVISFTCHNKVVDISPYIKYANNKGITLISGIEQTIEGKHVLILNCNQQADQIYTFKNLEIYKKQNPNILIIAPHPFFPTFECLHKKLIQNIHLFDAIEYNYCYLSWFNFNKKAIKIAQKYNLPVIATSDVHFLEYMNNCFTTIHTQKSDILSIINAVKHNSVTITTKSFSFFELTRLLYKMITLGKKNEAQKPESIFTKSL